MATMTVGNATSHWRRMMFAIVALAAAITLAIVLVVSATAGSGSTSKSPTPARVGHTSGATLCVAHGGGKAC